MKIMLPDESIKELPKGVTGLDVAESIGLLIQQHLVLSHLLATL